MDTKTILIFATRIFNSCSAQKAKISLSQLKTLLEEQGAPKECTFLIERMLQSIPETQAAAQKAVLTENDIYIAVRRASERKRREEQASHYGRC